MKVDKHTSWIFLIASILAVAVATTAQAGTTYYVTTDGSGHFTTIAAALSAAVSGDVVEVGTGTYEEHDLNFAGKDIVLRSVNGARFTTINCREMGRAFLFQNGETDNAVVQGFTIVNGVGGSPGGGAINIQSASPRISRNIFMLNDAAGGSGGAIHLWNSASKITNCLFFRNQAAGGGAVYINGMAGQPELLNNTFAQNTAVGGGAILLHGAVASVTNSILYGNTHSTRGAGDQIVLTHVDGELHLRNSDLEGGIAAIRNEFGGSVVDLGGNIDQDPMFYGPGGADNYHVQRNSPCIDSGHNQSYDDFAQTYERIGGRGDGTVIVDATLDAPNGVDRIVDGDGDGSTTIDMGAYEYREMPVTAGLDPVVNGSLLKSAVNSAKNGDTIFVSAGTFQLLSDRDLVTDKSVAIIAESGPSQTTVHGNWKYPALTLVLTNQNTVIDGFKFQGCVSPHTPSDDIIPSAMAGGAAINIYAGTPMIRNCVFNNNMASGVGSGGAILYQPIEGYPYTPFEWTPAHIVNCRFSGNSANTGGAVSVHRHMPLVILDSRFEWNTSSTAGGALYSTSGYHFSVKKTRFVGNSSIGGGAIALESEGSQSFTNCLFQGNKALFDEGGAIRVTGGSASQAYLASFQFCTLIQNEARHGGGGISADKDTNLVIVNSILWGNAASTGSQVQIDSEASFDLRYSIVEGGLDGIPDSQVAPDFGQHVTVEDPRFSFPDDPHLASVSPAIDSASGSVSQDLDGHTRSGTADMGAFEYVGESETALGVSPSQFRFSYRRGEPPPDSSLSLRNLGDTLLDFSIENIPGWLVISPMEPTIVDIDELVVKRFYVDPDAPELDISGVYSAELLVQDASSNPLRTIRVELTVHDEVRVSSASEIQPAINAAVDGGTIIVEKGEYTLAEPLIFNGKAITLRSESGPEHTIIRVPVNDYGVYFWSGEDRSSVLQGFTFKPPSDDVPTPEGAGVYILGSAPTIVRCVFDGLIAHDKGGGITLFGAKNARIARCVFRNNQATYGAGIHLDAGREVEIANCLFEGNVASEAGGGLYLKNSIVEGGYSQSVDECHIRRCTFQANQGGVRGGGVFAHSSLQHVEVSNCRFIANTAAQAGGLFNYSYKLVVRSSLFQGNWAATGGAIRSENSITMENCTLVENSANFIGGGIAQTHWHARIINTIFFDNTCTDDPETASYFVSKEDEEITSIVFDHSFVVPDKSSDSAAPEEMGNITQDVPGFVGDGDYRLTPGSPCIDAGKDIVGLYSDIRGSLRPIDGGNGEGGDPDGNAKFDIGAYEYSRYYGGSEGDQAASPFIDLRIESTVVLAGHEYEIQWQGKDPFPAFDDRIQQAGKYLVSLSLVDAAGREVELTEKPITMRLTPLGYSYTAAFDAGHIGTWRIRLSMVDDPNQFVESEPIIVEYRHVETVDMGKRIYPPEGAMADIKPETDIEDAVYWSEETKRLFAVRPTTVVVTWFGDENRTQEIPEVRHIDKPDTPQFHISGTPPVDLLPEGTTPYEMVKLLYTASGADVNGNQFAADNEGYSVLFFRDEQAETPEARERFMVVRTLHPDHDGHTLNFPEPGDAVLAEEITHDGHESVCGSGYVYREQGWYDGLGQNRAYDRENRDGPIFPVNAIAGDANDTSDDILVVWYQRPDAATGICWPYLPVEYETEPPEVPERIVVASGYGSGTLKPVDFGLPENMLIYNQPDDAAIGYNPNEEHAIFFTAQGSEHPGVFALRDDLNRMDADGAFTSLPFMLLKYRDPNQNNRWNFKAFQVVAASPRYRLAATVEDDPGGNARYYIDAAGILRELTEVYPGEFAAFPPYSYFIDAAGRLKTPHDDARNACYEFAGTAITPVDCLPVDSVKAHYIDENGALQVVTGAPPELLDNGLLTPCPPSEPEQCAFPENAYFVDPFGVLVAWDSYYRFHYTKSAGAEINPFYPLDQLTFGPCEASFTTTPDWVLDDKDGKLFAKNGGVHGGVQNVGVKYHYRLQSGFFYDRNPADGVQDPGTPVGTCVPLLDRGNQDTQGAYDPVEVTYAVGWPEDVPTLFVGETLMDAKRGLPNIKDQCVADVLFDQPVEQRDDMADHSHSVNLIDPLIEHASYGLEPAPEYPEDELPGVLEPEYNLATGRWEFAALPHHLKLRLTYDWVDEKLKLRGQYAEDTGEPTILLNQLTERDWDTIKDLLGEEENDKAAFETALERLVDLGNAGLAYPVDGSYPSLGFEAESKALTAGDARGTGYVTLAFNNHEDCAGPTTLEVIRVGGPLYRGEIKVVESNNPFEEKLTLRHNGDFGGKSDTRWFQWKYVPATFSGIPCPPEETPQSYGEDCAQIDWKDYFAVEALNGTSPDTTKDDYKEETENFYLGALDVTVKGTGRQLLGDKWFSVRYWDEGGLIDASDDDPEPDLSAWTRPQLYEGWIKRVMKKVNLYDQVVRDFHASDVDTLASMIAKAGKEYDGDVALNDEPEFLQSLGMIEVYETLLSRGIELADGVDSADINKALLFAGNRLADLYMMLGNEAYGDATDPTIGFSTEDGQVGAKAASFFCFENQVGSLLDEELALLRGMPEVGIPPYYNRLVWNFTLGDGEVAYKENYNITDQDTEDTNGDTFPDAANGIIDERDAMVLYPMGHGDAWGHYLSAVKKYYRLLLQDDFTWIPQSEAILVAGNPVQVDYRDERKFAMAAAAKARTGAEIVNLTYRKFYTEDPEGQWQGYKDPVTFGNPPERRAWGVDGWSKRAGQGAFFDWVMGNALLSDKPNVLKGVYAEDDQTVFDLGPDVSYAVGEGQLRVYFTGVRHEGQSDEEVYSGRLLTPGPGGDYTETDADTITLNWPAEDVDQGDELLFEIEVKDPSFTIRDIQRVDRTTVTELAEIASRFHEIQAMVDHADHQLNPLGLAKDLVPFDIDPSRMAAGESHFEQIYGKAVAAMNNTIAVFNHANQNTQMLRSQHDNLTDFDRNIENMEADYNNRLIEVYGYPYTADCGPGKTYTTAYCSSGPDLYHYMYIESSELTGQKSPNAYEYELELKKYEEDPLNADYELKEPETKMVSFHVDTDSRFGLIKPDSFKGSARKAPGEIQFALSELLQSWGRFNRAVEEYGNLVYSIKLQAELIEEQHGVNDEEIRILRDGRDSQMSLNDSIYTSKAIVLYAQMVARLETLVARAATEGVPGVVGAIVGWSNGTIVDPASAMRSGFMIAGAALTEASTMTANVASLVDLSSQQRKEIVSLQTNIELTENRNDFAMEQGIHQLKNLISNEAVMRLEIYNLMESMRQSGARYLAVLAKGERLLTDRQRFRTQTAAQIQDYRYKDMTFRMFRNEALQKYRAQFDMAARYVYLTAKAYDYETTLLDADTRAGEAFLTDIVKQRTIGTIENGVPLTGSGLADPMRRMWQNFQVLKSQLGLTNPQIETNRFSLREELFRIRMDAESNASWQRALEDSIVPNLWEVPEFRRFCRPFAPEGAPQPGIIIPFTTTVTPGLNFFRRPLVGGDSYYSSTNFASKIGSVGVWFSNYNTLGLTQTPRVYLVPAGEDILRTPSSSLADIRTWQVVDQKLPDPFPIVETEIANNPAWIPSVDTIFDEMFEIRRHSDFRAYHDSGYLNTSELKYDSRLIGRSVWNSRWLLIIPGQNLLYDPFEGLETFIHGPEANGGAGERTENGILDIKLFFETYGYSGN